MLSPKKPDEIREHEASGLKYFDQLSPLPERPQDDGRERDKAGIRTLHFDEY